jgi:hypothetical protein
VIAGTAAPDGYTRFHLPGADIVALGAVAEAVRRAIGDGSLYAYAAAHPARRELRGRGIAYAVPLPDGVTRVVIRHSRHGGLLAPVTGDRFLAPTRAPNELRTALRLAGAGVATPQVVAYAVYPAGPLFRRSDVATREVTGGTDLGTLFAVPRAVSELRVILDATAALLRALEQAGARHPDLNVGNVLIVPHADGSHQALVLDVDRVVFGRAGDRAIGESNLRRLLRSAQKRRAAGAAVVSDGDLAALAEAVGHPA